MMWSYFSDHGRFFHVIHCCCCCDRAQSMERNLLTSQLCRVQWHGCFIQMELHASSVWQKCKERESADNFEDTLAMGNRPFRWEHSLNEVSLDSFSTRLALLIDPHVGRVCILPSSHYPRCSSSGMHPPVFLRRGQQKHYCSGQRDDCG